MKERSRSWLKHLRVFISYRFTVIPEQLPVHQYLKVLLDEAKTSNMSDKVIYSNGHSGNGCRISTLVKKKKKHKINVMFCSVTVELHLTLNPTLLFSGH